MTTLVLLAVAIAAGADLWTTHRVLAAGGRELNPLLRGFLHRGGFAALTGAKLAITGGVVWFAFEMGYPLLALVPGVIAGWAARHNWRVLRRMNGGR